MLLLAHDNVVQEIPLWIITHQNARAICDGHISLLDKASCVLKSMWLSVIICPISDFLVYADAFVFDNFTLVQLLYLVLRLISVS